MATQNKSRNDASGHIRSIYDRNTDETTARFQPNALDEDFIGPGHSAIPAGGTPAVGYPWVSKLVKTGGTPTAAIVANSPAGIVQLAIDATSEKQESTLYANDQLNWDATKNLVFETRVAATVLPSAAAVEMVFGMQSAWIDGPDNASFYARFQMLASGLVNLQTKDGVNTVSVSSGVTLLAGVFHIFRIELIDPANTRFFIDGTEVSATKALSFAATGASAIMQPYSSVYKASGVGLGTLQIDMIQAGADRV